MSVPDFRQFAELQFLGPNLPQKNTLELSIWTNACNLRITYFK